MIDPAYPALSNAVAGSLLWRIGVAIVDAAAAAWRTSLTARAAAAMAPLATTASIAGIIAVSAAAALALQFTAPQYVRPGLPMAWPLMVIAVAAIVAVSAAAIERAWPHSMLARLVAPRRHAR